MAVHHLRELGGYKRLVGDLLLSNLIIFHGIHVDTLTKGLIMLRTSRNKVVGLLERNLKFSSLLKIYCYFSCPVLKNNSISVTFSVDRV